MQTVLKALRSRTVWAGILLFLLSGVEGVREMVSAEWLTPLSAILAVLVGYFRARPRVDFSGE